MINTGPMYNNTPHSQPHSHPNSLGGTNSSLSNSPYTSPSLISPIYDTAHMSLNGPPPVIGSAIADSGGGGGYWQTQTSSSAAAGTMLAPPPLQSQPHPQLPHAYPLMSQSVMDYGVPSQMGGAGGNVPDYGGVQDMGYMPDQQGRYIFQPDGSQIYVPYSHEQQQ